MKTLYRIALVFVLSAFATTSFAQQDIEEMIKLRAAEKVKQMCDNIESMANPKNSPKERNKYKGKAVRLFIANCEQYEEDGRLKKGVEMEITSTYRPKPRRRLMKDYFTGLMNMRYSTVKIESSDIHDIQMSKLRQIDDNTFVCTAVFIQVFVGYIDGKPVYSDRTKKSVKCYVLREETMDGNEYVVKLGDTKALDTERL
ncbi:hypothetical protein [Xylanibacter muris]|uniref:Uncharacterized protein n=1 Tax=Xylanibacter muris TaxID=2736290 RepID=A0ABX2ANX4_9BACT|nr:hypothetical protein [Xylanibacter muris]NPD92840.1 hypothetical protein [Xylanibacter muris]